MSVPLRGARTSMPIGVAPGDAGVVDGGSCSTLARPHNARMDIERHEAIGQKGEACIILVKSLALPNGRSERTYSLATGERLKPTDVPGEFVNLDGSRTFRLRR